MKTLIIRENKRYELTKALEIADIDSSYDNIVENYNSGYLTINVWFNVDSLLAIKSHLT